MALSFNKAESLLISTLSSRLLWLNIRGTG